MDRDEKGEGGRGRRDVEEVREVDTDREEEKDTWERNEMVQKRKLRNEI